MAVPVSQARIVVDSAGGLVGLLGRGGEARGGRPLHAEGLHGAHGADRLGGVGGGIGEPVLRRPRAPPHRPAGDDEGQRR